MAVHQKKDGVASGVIGSNTTTVGSTNILSSDSKNIIGVMTVSSRTDGTFVLKIQHSHDNSNWEDLKAGSNVTSNDTVYLSYSEAVDGGCFSHVRLVVVSTSVTTGATVAAELWHD